MTGVRVFGKPVALAKVPAGIAVEALAPVSSPSLAPLVIHLPVPLGSRPVTAFPRYYEHSDSCPSGSSAFLGHELQLLYGQVSLIHLLGPPTILSPTTCARSVLPRHVTCGQIEPGLHPTTGAFSHENPGLRLSLADSPHHAGRIEFSFLPHLGDFLRTGRSPPAALHPVSPRRSCSRLQVTLTWRGLPPLRLNALSGAVAHGAKPWEGATPDR